MLKKRSCTQILVNSNRERNRKERGAWEAERCIRRYDSECGKCVTYKIDKNELDQYFHGKILKKKDGDT